MACQPASQPAYQLGKGNRGAATGNGSSGSSSSRSRERGKRLGKKTGPGRGARRESQEKKKKTKRMKSAREAKISGAKTPSDNLMLHQRRWRQRRRQQQLIPLFFFFWLALRFAPLAFTIGWLANRLHSDSVSSALRQPRHQRNNVRLSLTEPALAPFVSHRWFFPSRRSLIRSQTDF